MGVLNQLAKTAKFETNKSSFSSPKSIRFFVGEVGGSRVQGLEVFEDLCRKGVIFQWFYEGGICHVKIEYIYALHYSSSIYTTFGRCSRK